MISEFPAFTGKIEHAHIVCTRPSLSQREGPGDEAMMGVVREGIDLNVTALTGQY